MKRVKQDQKQSRGVKYNPSDIYEVTFTKDCAKGSIKEGEKRFVSLPVAVKFVKEGKATMDEKYIKEAKDSGMYDAVVAYPKSTFRANVAEPKTKVKAGNA